MLLFLHSALQFAKYYYLDYSLCNHLKMPGVGSPFFFTDGGKQIFMLL